MSQGDSIVSQRRTRVRRPQTLEQSSKGSSVAGSDDRLLKAAAALKRLTQLGSVDGWQYEVAEADIPVMSLQDQRPRTYKADVLLAGIKPEEAFATLAQQEAWNSWFKESRVIENLGPATTHTCSAFSNARDISLIETKETLEDGTILFCTTSVTHPTCPPVPQAKRVSIDLSGFSLALLDDGNSHGTHVTWYLQAHKKALLPTLSVKRAIPRHMALALALLRRKTSRSESPQDSLSRNRSVSVFGKRSSRRSLLKDATGTTSTSRRSSLVNPASADHSGSVAVSAVPPVPPIPAALAAPTATEAAAPVPEKPLLEKDAGVPQAASPHLELLELKKTEFERLLEDSAAWSKTNDRNGHEIAYKDSPTGLPLVGLDMEFDARDGTTEDVLACFDSPLFRSRWLQRHRSTQYQDEGTLESLRGLYPHLPDFHYLSVSHTFHASASAFNHALLHLSTSAPAETPAVTHSTPAKLALAALKLAPIKGNRIRLQYVEQVDLEGLSIPAATQHAYILSVLASFVAFKHSVEGTKLLAEDGSPIALPFEFEPSFVRWAAPAVRVSNVARTDDGIAYDLVRTTKSADGPNIAWLTYPAAFKQGLELRTGSPAIQATRAPQVPRTIRVEFDPSTLTDGARLDVEPGQGDATEVFFNGQRLADTASPPANANGIAATPQAQAQANGIPRSNSIPAAAAVGLPPGLGAVKEELPGEPFEKAEIPDPEEQEAVYSVDDFVKDGQALDDVWTAPGVVRSVATGPLITPEQMLLIMSVAVLGVLVGRSM